MLAVVPGTFDPMTLGHLDVIERAADVFPEVAVAVAPSDSKTPWFTLSERCEMAAEACSHLSGVRVDTFDGLLVHYALRLGSRHIVKGLRTMSDFDFELRMAQANRVLAPGIETLFVMTSTQYAYLSSSVVREVVLFGGDITPMVPACMVEPLRARAEERKRGRHHRDA